jgi:hypothetical protein
MTGAAAEALRRQLRLLPPELAQLVNLTPNPNPRHLDHNLSPESGTLNPKP